MKLCSGDNRSSHPQIAFDEAFEHGHCPLCDMSHQLKYMRMTLFDFSNGLIPVKTLFSRLSDAGYFVSVPADMKDHPTMDAKLERKP
jgi:hypothetical protein